MTSADRRKKTDNDTYGESLDLIIETLENFELQMEVETNDA